MGLFRRKAQPLEVAKMGNPILRLKAEEISPEQLSDPAMLELVEAMVATMEAEGGIGIAAPQVSRSIQLAVIEIPAESPRYPESEPFELEVFVNPTITVLDETEHEFWEGCLSVPDLRALVPRPREVRVDYLGLDGKPRSISAEGFLATVLQHELDHLEGVLFVDRVRDTTTFATIDEYRTHWLDTHDAPTLEDD
jgi:peptide deformylase